MSDVESTIGELPATLTLTDTDLFLVETASGSRKITATNAGAGLSAVTSVNGETGAVSLSAADVGADAAGTAATAVAAAASSYATAAQGELAATAVQPGDLGTAAAADTGDFATAAQGTLADTALQPAAIGTTVQGYDADLADIAGLADAQGDILVRGATGWERLAKSSTATDVLTAGASQPAWAAASGGGGGTSYARPMTIASTYQLANGAAPGVEALMTIDYRTPYYFGAFQPLAPYRLVDAMIEVTTALTNAVIRIGLIELDANSQPVALVADYGTVSGATTGEKVISGVNVDVVPGKWYCNVVYSQVGGGSASIRVRPSSGAHGWGRVAAVTNRNTRWVSVTGWVDYTAGFPNPPANWNLADTGLNDRQAPLDAVFYTIGDTP